MTHYDILEVSSHASSEVIKNAYKALVKKHHPDNFENEVDKQTAEAKIKEIVEAYDILSDEEKKNAYDSELLSSKINSESTQPETSNDNKFERPRFNQQWLRWIVGLLILSIIGSGSYIFYLYQQKQEVALSVRKAEDARHDPVPPASDEEVKNIVGAWTFQKRKLFVFPDGNNYEVLLGTSRDYTLEKNISPTYHGKIFLLHYDQAKKTWLNVWYTQNPIIAYTSPEYVFPSLSVIQNTDTALVAVQIYGGGNGGFTNLTSFTVSHAGEVHSQKDMFLGNASLETKDDKIIVIGSGAVGIHELTLVNGRVNDKVTPRSEMGNQTGDSTKVYFLLRDDGTVMSANSSSIDIRVGDTVVFNPQDDTTKRAFDGGKISIYTNAWNDGPVNMSNSDELKSGNSYTFKKVGVFDFVLADSGDIRNNPMPTFTINVKS